MNENYTIKEAARVYEININTLYKYIQQGKINAQCHTTKGKKIKKITKSDIEQFLSINQQTEYNDAQQDTINDSQQNTIKSNGFKQNTIADNLLTKDNLKEVFKEFIEEQKAELIRPLEEHALVKYGALTTENKFLKERLETVIEENENLRNQLKALPGPPGEVIQKLEQIEAEKSALASQMEIATQVKQTALKEKEDAAATLQKKEQDVKEKDRLLSEKENTLQTLKQKTEELEKEKEHLLSQKEKEASELKEQMQKQEQEEKDLLATVAALKERLEREERKPWWRKIFG